MIPHSWGQTFVALIPKQENPIYVTAFCPISFFNICYKVISKILTNRLKYVIHKLVGPEQNGFIPERGASNNIIAAREIAYSLEIDTHATHPFKMILKIDIEKPFNIVEWIAILATLQRMCFPEK